MFPSLFKLSRLAAACLALLASAPAWANVQTTILHCFSESPDDSALYDVIENDTDAGVPTGYLLVQKLPVIPFHRQVWLNHPPQMTTKGLEIHDRGANGHVDIYPDPSSPEGYWILDINANGIVAQRPGSYRCYQGDPMGPALDAPLVDSKPVEPVQR